MHLNILAHKDLSFILLLWLILPQYNQLNTSAIYPTEEAP